MKKCSSRFRLALTIAMLAIALVLLLISDSWPPTNFVSAVSAQGKGGVVQPNPTPAPKPILPQPRSTSRAATPKNPQIVRSRRLEYAADIVDISTVAEGETSMLESRLPRVQLLSSNNCLLTWKVTYDMYSNSTYTIRLTDIDPASLKITDIKGPLVYRKGDGEWHVTLKTYDNKDSIKLTHSEFGGKDERKSHELYVYFNHEPELNRFFSGIQKAIRSCQKKSSHTVTTK